MQEYEAKTSDDNTSCEDMIETNRTKTDKKSARASSRWTTR